MTRLLVLLAVGLTLTISLTNAEIVKFSECFDGMVDPTGPLPDKHKPVLPNVYTILMTVNDELKKTSHIVEFGNTGSKSFARSVYDGQRIITIIDYDRKQFIEVLTPSLFAPTERVCKVSKLTETIVNENSVIGIEDDGTHAHPESLLNVLEFQLTLKDLKYIGPKELYKVVPTHYIVGCQKVKETYVGYESFWLDTGLDNKAWIPPFKHDNYSVPVAFVKTIRDVATKNILYKEIYDISAYIPMIPPPDIMSQIPSGVFCEGLKSNALTPDFKKPDYYSYTEELVLNTGIDVTLLGNEKLIPYQQIFYDHKLKLSRRKYREIPDTTKMMTKIHDFNLGLAYTINNDAGTCNTTVIPTTEGDVQVINGKVEMRDPLSILETPGEWVYYEDRVERGLKAQVYRRRQQMGDKLNMVYEYWVAEGNQEFQGSFNWTKKIPMKIVTYPDGAPFGKGRVETNMFNFDSDEPEVLDYDITACSDPANRKHLEFQLQGRYDQLGMKSLFEFKHQALASLMTILLVDVLRVHDIQFEVVADRTFVSFTLLDRPRIQGDALNGVNLETETTSENAVKYLRETLNSGKVYVGTPGIKVPQYMKGIPNTLAVLSTRSEKRFVETGYSSGSMAGLGVGMAVLGIVIGGGAAFLFFLRSK